MQGQTAPVLLSYDGDEFNAGRLAAEHFTTAPVFTGTPAGATFRLRVGDGLQTDAALATWRQGFVTAAALVRVPDKAIHLSVPANAAASWFDPQSVEPTPARSALELNGQDFAQKVLQWTAARTPTNSLAASLGLGQFGQFGDDIRIDTAPSLGQREEQF